MCRWLVLFLVLWNTIRSQPITDESENVRQSRQLDFECCPCTGPRAGLRDLPADPGAVGRGAGVDDCPCQLRDADSQGSSSLFLPRAMRPLRPVLKQAESKEDHKPLLHPEVDLASSVLETLRAVTDEEYEDAVARDAARTAAGFSEPDVIIRDTSSTPETNKNIVTIFLNPKSEEDELVSEASNVHESHFAHPLESPNDSVDQIRLNKLSNLRDILNLPKREPKGLFHNVNDMDSGASNVQEHVVDKMNKGLHGLKLRSNPHVIHNINQNTSFKLRNIAKSMKNADEGFQNSDTNLKSNVPDLRLNEKIKPNNAKEGANSNTFKNPLISRLRSNPFQISKVNSFSNLDNGASPSNVVKQFFERTKSPQTSISKLKTLMPKDDIDLTKKPFGIKNLLQLRDVELIPPKSNKAKITMPGIKLPPAIRSSNKNTGVNNFAEERSSDSIHLENCDEEAEYSETNSNKDLITNDKSVETEILDAVPSPSENHKIISVPNDHLESSRDQIEDELMLRDKSVSTEILDAIPSPSKNHHIDTVSNDNLESNRDQLEDELLPGDKPISTEIVDAIPSLSENHHTDTVNEDNLDTNTDQSDEDFDFTTDSIDSVILLNSEETDAINTSEFPEEEVEISDLNDIFIKEEKIDPGIVIENAQTNQAGGGSANSNELNIADFENDDNNQDTAADIVQTVSQEESEINNFNLIPDSVPETSNDVTLILPPEEINNNVGEPSLESSFRTEDSTQNAHQDHLTSNTNSVPFKANGRFNTNAEVPTQFERNDNERSGESSLNENVNIINSLEDESLTKTLAPPVFTSMKLEKPTENTNQVNFQDLQKLSNSILDLSNRKKQYSRDFKTECETTIKDEKLRPSEVSDNETANTPIVSDKLTDRADLESSGTSPQIKVLDNFNNPIVQSIESQDNDNRPNLNLSKQENNDSSNINNVNDDIKGMGCLQFRNDEIKTGDSNVQPAEMIAEASAPVIKIIPQAISKSLRDTSSRSSLLQNIVTQPSSLFGENNLFSRPFPDFQNLLNSNTQLPTLDDIQSSISNIIGGNERHADEEDLSSTEIDNANDCSNSNSVMSTGSSTTKSKKIFPVLKPLENINLDIFQINPLQARIPSLNLNSYKAKLPIPKSLNLKPIKLQSSLGKNGGLLGATLTFGPDKIGSAQNTNPSSILNRKGSGSLQNRLGTVSSLDELRSTMKTNAENLLKSPLTMPRNTLRSGQISALSDNLRFRTANTMKNIQQTLASSLNVATVKGDKFAKPQDFLEMVSTAHDDATDKLQAIHTDLTDRLTSLHENIVDQSNLPSLQTHVLKDIRRKFSNNRQRKPNSVLKIPQNNRSQKARAYTTNSQNGKLNPAQARTITEQIKFKPYKMSKAASTLTPKSVEVPKLTTTSTKSSFSKPLQRDSKVKLKESKPIAITRETIKPQDARHVINKFKPLGESRVKVTISTTARPSTVTNFKTKPLSTTPKPRFGTKTSQFKNDKLQATPRSDHIRSKPVSSRQHFKPLIDSKVFASELKPSVIQAPVKPNSLSKSADSETIIAKGRSSQLRQSPNISEDTKPKPSLFNQSVGASTSQLTTGSFMPKSATIRDSTIPTSENKPTARNVKPQPLVWPKVTDDAFLSKVREALRAKYSNLNVNKPTEKVRINTKVKPLDSDDMLKSASDNKEVMLVDENPLKENVSYRCRMVCVREPIEP